MIDIAVLEDQILSLSPQERGRLASLLLRSLNVPENEMDPAEWNQLWAIEAQRRLAEMESGEVEGIPWEVVQAEARDLLK